MNLNIPTKEELTNKLIADLNDIGITQSEGTVQGQFQTVVDQLLTYLETAQDELQDEVDTNEDILKLLYNLFGSNAEQTNEFEVTMNMYVSNGLIKDKLPFSDLPYVQTFNTYSITIDTYSFYEDKQIIEDDYNELQNTEQLQIKATIKLINISELSIEKTQIFNLDNGITLVQINSTTLKTEVDISSVNEIIKSTYSGYINNDTSYNQLQFNDEMIKQMIKDLANINDILDIKIVKDLPYIDIIIYPTDATKNIDIAAIQEQVEAFEPTYLDISQMEQTLYKVDITTTIVTNSTYDETTFVDYMKKYFTTNYSKLEIEKIKTYMANSTMIESVTSATFDITLQLPNNTEITIGEVTSDITLDDYSVIILKDLIITKA